MFKVDLFVSWFTAFNAEGLVAIGDGKLNENEKVVLTII